MILKYRGVCSTRHFLHGSAPQGVFLGILLFIVKFNGAFLRPKVPRNLNINSCTLNRRCHTEVCTCKFIDDSCHARSVDLTRCLTTNNENIVHQVTYYERTGHVLHPEHNQLQLDMDQFSEFDSRNKPDPANLSSTQIGWMFLPSLAQTSCWQLLSFAKM